MKKKEIITLVIALVVIVGSAYGAYRILFPKTKVETQGVKTEVVPVPSEIDNTTYGAVEGLKDYGKPNIDSVGKTDLFQYGGSPSRPVRVTPATPITTEAPATPATSEGATTEATEVSVDGQ